MTDRIEHDMDLKRFEALLDQYGAEIATWPEATVGKADFKRDERLVAIDNDQPSIVADSKGRSAACG